MTTRTWVFSLSVLVAFLQPAHGQTCLITNPAQPFSASISRVTNSVTLTWGPTCTNFAFGVFSTDQLTSNTQWQSRAGMWGSLLAPVNTRTQPSPTAHDSTRFCASSLQAPPIGMATEYLMCLNYNTV